MQDPPPQAPKPLRGSRDLALGARTPRVLHLDVDAFLASVEVARNPRLLGREVIVGGAPNSRNLVMSCSYEARAKGVRPGMRSNEAAQRCPRAVFLPGDSQEANRKRLEIARVLLDVSPRVELASIDDFFVDLTGSARLQGDAFVVAERIRERVASEVRMPLTIGVGTSKILARLAGKLAKPGGVAEILPGFERAFLSRLPVEHLPGVGHSAQAKLAAFAIRTVGDLRLVSREVLFATFGTLGLVLHDRARGIDTEPVEAGCHLDEDGEVGVRPPRSIRRDSTFEPEEGRPEQIEAMLAYLVDRAAARLRGHGLIAGSMEVRLLHVDTRPPHVRRAAGGHGSGQAQTRRRLSEPCADTDRLWEHARALLRALPRRRALVKRVGLTLLNLRTSRGRQGLLFSDPERDRAPRSQGLSGKGPSGQGQAAPGSRDDRARALDQALDDLRSRHGFGALVRGASLPLIQDHELGGDGFVLRTPSLNQ